MNDWQLSQWISQALAGELDDAQQAELQAALQRSPASQAFAQWSSWIQSAAAETSRIESMPPDAAAVDPAERLSDLSKARLQRTLLAAQVEWGGRGSQQQLRVAQAPSFYGGRPAGAEEREEGEELEGGESQLEKSRKSDELLRGGRELRGRLIARLSGVPQSLRWVVELASPLKAHVTPSQASAQPASTVESSSAAVPLSLAQLTSVIVSILRVQDSLCAISIAGYRADNFDELLRVQRGPRDVSRLRVVPNDRLRQGSASPFHRAVLGAPSLTPILDVDRSIAGWPRIALGLPLAVPQLQTPQLESFAADAAAGGDRWGLAIVEVDIDRLVSTQVAAVAVDAEVVLVDQHDRILSSTRPRSGTLTKPVNPSSGGAEHLPVDELAQTGEMHLLGAGLWGTLLPCPAPLDNLRLLLRAR